MDLSVATISEAAAALRRRELSATDLVRACLDRIAATDPQLNGFITVCAEESLAAAAEADRRLKAAETTPPLLGIPVALKDIFVTEGVRTTCASKILASFVPPYESTAGARLREAGAIIVGKTNLDEFGMGSSTENSAFGATRNPWNPERVAGGSSGGSAVAVASGQCLGALGTDTGGSIRLPAAFCGTVGMKPTYGRVSRYGVIAYASSLDQVGPLARTVADCALILQTIAGFDPMDSTTVNAPVPPYPALLGQGVKDLRLGIPREYFVEGMQPEVHEAVTAAVRELERLGAHAEPISLPHTGYAIAAYYLIATAEASSNLARYDGVRFGHRASKPADLGDLYRRTRAEGFGPEVKRRILLGTYALSAGYYDAYYLKAQKVRTLIRQDFRHAFETCDAIIAPVSPTTAFSLGEKLADPLQMYLSDILTISVNLAGLPGLSLPCGMDRAGLPIGLQVIGRPLDETTVLRIGHAFEQATPWHRNHPAC